MALLEYRARITFKSSAQKDAACKKKALLKSQLISLVKFLQGIDVISKLLCTWGGASG